MQIHIVLRTTKKEKLIFRIIRLFVLFVIISILSWTMMAIVFARSARPTFKYKSTIQNKMRTLAVHPVNTMYAWYPAEMLGVMGNYS